MRLRIPPVCIAFAAVVLGLFVVWRLAWTFMFRQNDQYTLEHLELHTGVAKTPQEIISIAGDCLIEGQSNLFRFSASRLREDLLASSLNIAEVEISKQLPDTVRVVVKDRIPVAKLLSDSRVLDEDGLVFTLLPQDESRYLKLPKIENGADQNLDVTPGRRLQDELGTPTAPYPRIMRALKVLNALNDIAEPPFHVRIVDVSGSTYMTLLTDEYMEVRFAWEELSSPSRLAKLLDRAAAAYPAALSKGKSRMDVLLIGEGKVFAD